MKKFFFFAIFTFVFVFSALRAQQVPNFNWNLLRPMVAESAVTQRVTVGDGVLFASPVRETSQGDVYDTQTLNVWVRFSNGSVGTIGVRITGQPSSWEFFKTISYPYVVRNIYQEVTLIPGADPRIASSYYLQYEKAF